jgi:hypothetical protein
VSSNACLAEYPDPARSLVAKPPPAAIPYKQIISLRTA